MRVVEEVSQFMKQRDGRWAAGFQGGGGPVANFVTGGTRPGQGHGRWGRDIGMLSQPGSRRTASRFISRHQLGRFLPKNVIHEANPTAGLPARKQVFLRAGHGTFRWAIVV